MTITFYILLLIAGQQPQTLGSGKMPTLEACSQQVSTFLQKLASAPPHEGMTLQAGCHIVIEPQPGA